MDDIRRTVDLRKRAQDDASAKTTAKPLPAIHSDKPLIEWSSRDHVPQKRSFIWHAGVVIVSAALIAYAILVFNFLFALFVLAASVALVVASSRPVDTHNIAIFPRGIEVEGLPSLMFADIESFWIFPDTAPAMLSLRPRHRIRFPTYLLLENVDSENVREVLLNYIPEREEEFPFMERVTRWLGF